MLNKYTAGFVFCGLAVFVFASPLAAYSFEGIVVSCQTGDMIEVQNRKAVEKIYFYDITVPDTKETAAFLNGLVLDKNVKVEVLGNRKEQGKYAEVTLPDGRDLQYVLIEQGYAVVKDESNAKRRGLKRIESQAVAKYKTTSQQAAQTAQPEKNEPSHPVLKPVVSKTTAIKDNPAKANTEKPQTLANASKPEVKQPSAHVSEKPQTTKPVQKTISASHKSEIVKEKQGPSSSDKKEEKGFFKLCIDFILNMYHIMARFFSDLANRFAK